MARRDVELVIRARNEATKAIASIGDALQGLVDAQADVAGSAARTDSVLNRLGTALADLDRQFKGMTGAEKISAELDRAFQATGRLASETRQTAAEQARFAAEAADAAAQTTKLRQESEALAAAVKQQQAAVSGAKQRQQDLNKALREATAERDRLAAADARTAQAIGKQEAAIQRVADRYERYKAELAAAERPTMTLKNAVEAAAESLEKKRAKLTVLNEKLAQTRTAAADTAGSVDRLQAQLAEAAESFGQQATALEQAQRSYREIQAAVKSAGDNQKQLEAAAESTADALVKQQAALAKASAEMAELTAVAAKADQALSDLAAGAGDALRRSFDQQRRAMLETKREWATAEGAVRDLAQQIQRTAEPNAALAAAFDRVRAAAAQAKKEYLAQRDGLVEMGRVLRTAGTDVDSLRQQQQRFADAQASTAASLARIRADAAQAAAGQRSVGSAAAAAGTGLNQVARAGQAARTGMQQASQSTISFAQALRQLYGESRTAMSWTQRLRGEILSMVAAYGGLYAAVEAIGSVVRAYVSLEAAQSRLNAAFDGNQTQVAVELDFIRRNADRLGLQFGVLAEEYGKFAANTKGTTLAGQATRDIFISVSEAARVNKLSLEQLQGALNALGQIASKGRVQMEELKEQLGDRLPGVVKLMADGLGVGTDALIKMMEQGQVSSTSLIAFAKQMDKQFGPGLATALQGTSYEMGRLENSVFNAQKVIAEGGFIDSFTRMVRQLNETLRSADAEAFFKRVSAALGALTDVLAAAIRHWDLLVVAMMAVIGVKIAPFVLLLVERFRALYLQLTLAPAAFVAVATQARGAAVAMGTLQTAVTGLRAALAALMSSTGIGLLVTGISVAIGVWATQADKATAAMNGHQKVVDQVKNAYDKAGGAAKDWAAEVAKGSRTQAIAHLEEFRKALDEIRESARAPVDAFGRDTTGTVRRIQDAVAAFKTGSLSAAEFKKQIDDLAQANPELNRNLVLGLLSLAENAVTAEKNVAQAEAVVAVLNGTANQAQMALLGLGEGTDDAAAALKRAEEAAKRFREGLDKIKSKIPELSDEMKRLKDLEEIETLYTGLKKDVTDPAQLAQLEAAKQQAVEGINEASAAKIAKAITDKIVAVESGGRAAAKNAVSTATGAGQFIEKTWLSLFKKYFPDRADSLTDAMMLELRKDAGLSKKLIEAYATENAKVLQKAGLSVTEASLYLAHFLGPNGAAKVLQKFAEDPNALASSVLSRDAVKANKSILEGKSVGDVIAFANQKMGVSPAEAEVAEKVATMRDKAADAVEKFNREIKKGIADRDFEIAQTRLINSGQERQAAINEALHEAEQKAIAAKTVLREEDRQEIVRSTGALFDQTKAHELASQKVNELLALRSELREQYELAQQSGDFAAEDAAYQAILGINDQLKSAIDNAIAMWQAIGGPAADAAIAKLKTLKVTVTTGAQQALIDWKAVGTYAAGGLAGAFDSFAQKVVEGENAGRAARDAFLQFASDFLRMIAQMIIQQTILNALKAMFPGTFGVGVSHAGGIAGSSNRTRQVSPMWFANAIHYHNGGIAGLRPNEVPAILERGEEILTTSDPRHRFNGGGESAGAAPVNVTPKIVNAFDTASFLEAALNSKVGERAILNFVRANPGAFKAALG